MYTNFMTDPRVLAQAREHWARILSSVPGWRVPWFSHFEFEGEHVASAVNEKLRRGVTVQFAAPATGWGTASLSTFGTEPDEQVRSLDVAFEPTGQNQQTAEELVLLWLRGGSEDEVRQRTESAWAHTWTKD